MKSSALDLPKISGAAVGDKDSLITVVEEPEPDPLPTEEIDLNGPNADFYKAPFYGVLHQVKINL